MQTICMIVWNEFLNDARVLKEAQTLQAAGYQVIVHALHTPGISAKHETLESGIKVIRVSRSDLSSISHVLIRRLLTIFTRLKMHFCLFFNLLKSKPDVIHAHDVNTLPLAWFTAIVTGKPLVYDAHEISTSREGYAQFRSLVFAIEKYLLPRVCATITTTQTRAKFLARAYHISRPLVLQNRPRYMALEKTSYIKDKLQLQQDWPIVLYQGGLSQGRGLERLMDAAAQIDHAYFVLIGSGRLETTLKAKVQHLQLQNKVHFISTVPLDELLYYTASADIGLQILENTCFNHYSTDSNKLFEYMMAGLPLIASCFPEIKKIVTQNNAGLLIPPGDTNALIRAIRTLITEPKLRHTYGSNAKQAAQHLNWEDQEQTLVTLYQRILKTTADVA